MAQLPPAPTGVDVSTAEQYTVPQGGPANASGGVWEVDTGYYWLIQSLTAETAGIPSDPAPWTGLVQAVDQDGDLLIDALGSPMLNEELAEATVRFQASPGIGASGTAAIGSTIPLPAVWLPPSAVITFTIRKEDGSDSGTGITQASLTVTRAHYTGTVGGSVGDELPLATPIVP